MENQLDIRPEASAAGIVIRQQGAAKDQYSTFGGPVAALPICNAATWRAAGSGANTKCDG